MEAEPTWRCWHASVHTARFLYSSQSQTSCFALATPKDRLWQVTTDASQYVRDRVRALTQEKDYVLLVYMVRENKVIYVIFRLENYLLNELEHLRGHGDGKKYEIGGQIIFQCF